jgi:hypothetical protein
MRDSRRGRHQWIPIDYSVMARWVCVDSDSKIVKGMEEFLWDCARRRPVIPGFPG